MISTYGRYKFEDVKFSSNIESIKIGLMSLNQNAEFEVIETQTGFKIIYEGNYNNVPKITVEISYIFKQVLYDDVCVYNFMMKSNYLENDFDLQNMEDFIDFFIDAYIRDIGNNIYQMEN